MAGGIMPADVPTLMLKGLAEGLTLHAAEREPRDADGLVDRFEHLLGRRPHANQIESVLRDAREADFVRSPDDGAIQLTQQGARRLSTYRRLPDAFKRALVELFRIEEAAPVDEARPAEGTAGARREPTQPGWVDEVLAEIPDPIEVQAPYASVSLDRDPAGRSWTLHVERHEPGRYEGARSCPLTFLYEAAARLLSEARGPPREARATSGSP